MWQIMKNSGSNMLWRHFAGMDWSHLINFFFPINMSHIFSVVFPYTIPTNKAHWFCIPHGQQYVDTWQSDLHVLGVLIIQFQKTGY